MSARDLMMVGDNRTRGPAEEAEHLSRSATSVPAWRLLTQRGGSVAVHTASGRGRFAEYCRQGELTDNYIQHYNEGGTTHPAHFIHIRIGPYDGLKQ